MREIKFRAWNESSNEMSPLTQITFSGGGTWSVEKGKGVSLEFQPHIKVMQYTGLKDKNGKEIYEGDVVKKYMSDGQFLHAPFAVLYQSEVCGFNINGKKSHSYEVIGDIYQNPELIK